MSRQHASMVPEKMPWPGRLYRNPGAAESGEEDISARSSEVPVTSPEAADAVVDVLSDVRTLSKSICDDAPPKANTMASLATPEARVIATRGGGAKTVPAR